MSNPIPNTDNLRIAIIAAALELTEITAPKTQKDPDTLETRLETFKQAYESIWNIVQPKH